MELIKSSLEKIRNLRRQKLSELLFPSYGARREGILYGGSVVSFIEAEEEIGYYIHRDNQVYDFYVKKEFDYMAGECFKSLLSEMEKPVFNIRSDDSLLINLVLNYLVDFQKGGYLCVRDRRRQMPVFEDKSLSFLHLSSNNFEDSWKILSQDFSFFYEVNEPSQKERFRNCIGKNMFFCLLEMDQVIGLGYQQVVRNDCAELGVIIDEKKRNKGYGTLLLAELTRLLESKGYKGFVELPRSDIIGRKLMEKIGFYVVAKYFIATIKGKIEDSNMKKRSRRYSLTGSFKLL